MRTDLESDQNWLDISFLPTSLTVSTITGLTVNLTFAEICLDLDMKVNILSNIHSTLSRGKCFSLVETGDSALVTPVFSHRKAEGREIRPLGRSMGESARSESWSPSGPGSSL